MKIGDDHISRQNAIDAFRKELCREREYIISFKGCERILSNVPSAQPEQRWIPVTERLPKRAGNYLVTDHNGEIVRYIFLDSESSKEYWMRCAKAWMPLPEPYKEERKDDEQIRGFGL